jgi:hypothetical protein
MDPRTVRIRALNDELRQNLAAGVAVMTPGVAALGQEAVPMKTAQKRRNLGLQCAR